MRVVNVQSWKSLALNVQLERRPPGSRYWPDLPVGNSTRKSLRERPCKSSCRS